MAEPTTTIGGLNGWQVLMFRVNLIALPTLLVAIITLGTWFVQELHASNNKDLVIDTQLKMVIASYQSKDLAASQRERMRREILEEVAQKYPPKHLIDKVEDLKGRISRLENQTP